jgi:hypothetical protein
MTVVTHENFESAKAQVLAGSARFVIPTYTRCTVIDRKTIGKFEARGLQVVWPSSDGRGFRLASGRSSVYVMPGYLKLQAL